MALADVRTAQGLHPALAYFNSGQQASHHASLDGTGDANDDANASGSSEAAACGISPLVEFDSSLGLTGNIISAVASIPYTVTIDKDGHFELVARDSLTYNSLTYLSSSTLWNHTIVGWTGEVTSAPVSNSQKTANSCQPQFVTGVSGKLGNVTIRDAESANLKGAFANHFKGGQSKQQIFSISKQQRTELETLLEHAFQDKILPVWLGDWSDSQDGCLILNDQDRWLKYPHHIFNPEEFATMGASSDKSLADFRQMNEAVADAIFKVYNPGDIIWIHDCSLVLLPAMLRGKLPSAYICYYHNVESFAKTGLDVVTQHEEFIHGLLGASAVGVPSREMWYNFADHFLSQLKLRTEYDGVFHVGDHQLSLVHVPIVGSLKFVKPTLGRDNKVQTVVNAISERYKDETLLVALTDRDSLQALQTLLSGYDHFLQNHTTAIKNKTVLVLLIDLDPSLVGTGPTTKVASLDGKTSQLIVNVNAKHSTATYQPIVCINGTSTPLESLALLRLADLCVVAAGQRAELFMGVDVTVAQEEKQSPLLICVTRSQDSTDAEGVARSIEDGLMMSPCDKERNHAALLDYFAKRNSKILTDGFLHKACNAFSKMPVLQQIPVLATEVLIDTYTSRDKRLMMFDFDGTLTPIVNDPDAAIPTQYLLTALDKLSQKDEVWLISGRSRTFLQQHFGGISGIGLSAEHGSFVRYPGSNNWNNFAELMDMGWKSQAEFVFSRLCGEVPFSWIERKEVAIVWHYRNALDHDACLAKAVEAKATLESEYLKDWDVDVMLGKANLEVRPSFLNKGSMAETLIKEVFGQSQIGFVLCAGDDTTDEDMFRAILSSKLNKSGVFSCLVSTFDKPSLASFRVDEPHNLVEAIARLSNIGE